MKTRKKLLISVPTQRELMARHSRVAQAARMRGNAAGVHGGARSRYGTAERREARRDERNARFGAAD